MTETKSQINQGPIINLVDDEKAKSISWEVNDGIDEVEEVKDLLRQGFEKENKPTEQVQEDNEEKEEEVNTHEEQEASNADNEDEEDEEEKVKKREHKVPRNKRISELVREKKGYKALAEDNILQRNQLQQENDMLRQELLKKEKEKLESYDQTLKANIDNIKRTLTIAKEEGDYQTETEATDLLAQYNAEKIRAIQERDRISSLYNQNHQSNQNKQNQPQNQDYDPISAEYKDNAMNWIKNNSWADPKSSNFDRDMHEEAADFEVRLAKAYKLQGKGDEVGSENFWNQISDHIVEEFDLPLPKKQTPKQNKLVMADSNSPVAPVTRSNITPNAPAKNKPQPLSPQEKQIAHKLYGKIRDDKGKLITDLKQCEQAYMRYKTAGI